MRTSCARYVLFTLNPHPLPRARITLLTSNPQLNVRIPSMLIRRDGLMAQPYPMAHNFVKLMSARYAPPTAGYTMNPLQQREAMMKEQFESKRKELLQSATNNTGGGVEYVAKSWLSV